MEFSTRGQTAGQRASQCTEDNAVSHGVHRAAGKCSDTWKGLERIPGDRQDQGMGAPNMLLDQLQQQFGVDLRCPSVI